MLLALLWATAASAVGVVDPLLRFQQHRTAHFVIYFHAGEEQLAARLAALVEEVRTEVGRSLGFEPPARTHVILADQSELANGWATPLPRNVIFLTAAAPSGADFIGRTDNWLRLVFTHEYTHIAHLDLSRGWSRVARGMLGRSPIAFPNLWLPLWQIEGLATWHESGLAGEGRLHAGDFRAVERLAAVTRGIEPLDRVNGGLVRWPAGHAPYVYGAGFHEYLAERFGQEKLGDLAEATARRLPYFGSRAFRPVFGASLGRLWREYGREAASARPAGSTMPGVRRLTARGQFVSGPRFAPSACDGCPTEIVYSVRNPDTFPELRAMAADGSNDRALALRYLGDTAGVTGTHVLFDQHELRRNVGLYSDLYLLDRSSGGVRALTREARLIDPDVSRDGTVAAVRQARDRRELVVVKGALAGPGASGGTVDADVLASAPDVQFSTPRWSPDGRLIVAERRRLGALPELVLVDVVRAELRVLASDRGARIVTPTWRPDGGAVVAAADFDGGPFDLYEFPLGGGAARRLTRTNGAYWPDVSPDGRTVVFAGYTLTGFDLFTAPYAPAETLRTLQPAEEPADLPAARAPLEGTRYLPWRTIAPTFWTPILWQDNAQTRAGALVSGSDVLGRHAYAANATWLVDGPRAERGPGRAPDWTVSYAYTRWRPTLFAAASRETSFLRLDGESNGGLTTLEQREWQAGIAVPFLHARRSEQVLASVVSTENRYLFMDRTRASRNVSARFAAASRTARVYGYSISPEDGILAGATLDVAREALGARADATTATLDTRAYLRGLGRHQVLALRAAGGVSNGPAGTRRVFQLGGVQASPGVVDFGSNALALLRGFPASSVGGTRIAVLNAEYRLPLTRVERGIGTVPLLLRWLHAAAFVDAGQVWTPGRPRSNWKTSWGGELSADMVGGYALPLTATVGVAWGRDGDRARGATIYGRIGRAF